MKALLKMDKYGRDDTLLLALKTLGWLLGTKLLLYSSFAILFMVRRKERLQIKDEFGQILNFFINGVQGYV